jgi:hypothetical protein
MRRLLITAILFTAALAAVPSLATAKGVREAEVCGATGCRDVDDGNLFAFLPDGSSARPPSAGAPFVTVTVTMEHDRSEGGGFEYDYLPSLGLTRTHDLSTYGEWVKLSPRSRAALDGAIAGTKLRPAAQLGELPEPAPAPAHAPATDGGPPSWAISGAALAAIALLALAARYATSALKARPRPSKEANRAPTRPVP